MRKNMTSIFLICLMILGFMSVSACSNTWDGIGRDIEKMGKDIQD